MTELLTWAFDNQVELLALLASVWALISLVVRLTPTPNDDAVLARVWSALEHISFWQHKDDLGTWSMPGRPTKRQSDPEQKRLTGRIK